MAWRSILPEVLICMAMVKNAKKEIDGAELGPCENIENMPFSLAMVHATKCSSTVTDGQQPVITTL